MMIFTTVNLHYLLMPPILLTAINILIIVLCGAEFNFVPESTSSHKVFTCTRLKHKRIFVVDLIIGDPTLLSVTMCASESFFFIIPTHALY